ARDLMLLGDPQKPLIEVTDVVTTATEDFIDTAASAPAERAVNINLARIETPDDVKRAITTAGKVFADDIDEARRGVQSNEETLRLADALGMTPEQLLSRQRGQSFNAEEAVAARQILVSSGEQLVRLAK